MFIDQVLVAVNLPPYSDRRLHQQCPFPLNTLFLHLLPPSLLCMGLKRKLVYKLMSSQRFWVKVLSSSSSFLCELCAMCNSQLNNVLLCSICGIGYSSVSEHKECKELNQSLVLILLRTLYVCFEWEAVA